MIGKTTVRRVALNNPGVIEEVKPVKEKKPRKRWSRFINETEEERKARMTKTSLEWYEKHKDDPEFMESRRRYASEYYKKKKAIREAQIESELEQDEIDQERREKLQKIKDRAIRKAEKRKQYREANE